MLYELIGIVRPGNVNEVKEYAFSTTSADSQFFHHLPSIHGPYLRQPFLRFAANIEPPRIAKTAALTVLNAGGVVRGITNWGTFLLPKPLRVHQVLHHRGHYFIMRFDSGARTQHAVRKTIGLDPRMIRFSVVKMGFTLDKIKDVGGTAEWGSKTRGLGERNSDLGDSLGIGR
ncbi:MAG: hypothetical protein M1820_008394 [Bogoriella megaspora]|nr:MAG: hypothetical protein M1820_008394 [Bogoriella megaspora]